MKLKDLAEVQKAKKDLEAIVKAWCAFKEGGKTAKKKTAKRKTKR